ncbi:MAG: biotin--[acetyl-CoA-carboxylase] ligase [Desulfobacterales bacterium]|nr:biotin--[acetyl-CoA-carboxylase] ligase [Desulfobacterales bacterium]
MELWGSGSAAGNPARIARQHSLWQQDIHDFGPWTPVSMEPNQLAADTIWRSAKTHGDEKVIIWGPCDSALDVAWALSQGGYMEAWDSVVAVSQAAGRGQRHRNWTSPPGNLYAAWRWPGPDSLSTPGWEGLLSLLAGYLLAETLIAKGLSVWIKWPNDLLVKDRKVGGILLEQKHGQTMVGIGINIAGHPQAHVLREALAIPATSLYNEGLMTTPVSLWLEMVETGKRKFYQIVESLSPEEWTAALNRRLAWLGKRVRVCIGNQAPYEATIKGLAKDGGLELQAGSNTHKIYSGTLLPT